MEGAFGQRVCGAWMASERVDSSALSASPPLPNPSFGAIRLPLPPSPTSRVPCSPQVHSFTSNVLAGIFWFLFPVSLVVCNDSMAYFCGMAFGRKLIHRPFLGDLSPNKYAARRVSAQHTRARIHRPRPRCQECVAKRARCQACNGECALPSVQRRGRVCQVRRPPPGGMVCHHRRTWEGFILGGLCTVAFAFLTPAYYARLPFLVCPPEELSLTGFLFGKAPLALTCDIPAPFSTLTTVTPPLWPSALGEAPTLTVHPIQLHALALGLFASVVAPFGGFFASGIKRAYKLDDFASIIPGHGGVFDRVDCQLIMGLATQTYHATFIGPAAILSVTGLYSLALALSTEDQLDLYAKLGASLREQRLIR